MTLRFLLTTSILIVVCSICSSQEETKPDAFRFASIKYHAGRHLYTGHQLDEQLKNGYRSIEVRFGWQSSGKHEWEKYYNYPSYGIGYYTGFIGDIDVLGQPHALFGFISFPFSTHRKTNFYAEPALGLTFNLKPYDPNRNAINDAIGARISAYVSIQLGGQTKLNREMDLLYGVDLTHFSNGRMVTPNLGLNMAGFNLGFRYNFNAAQAGVDKSLYPKTILDARPHLDRAPKPLPVRENNISLYQAFGTVQNKDNAGTGHRYLISSTLLEYQHKFNIKHGVSFGVDFMVDPSARDTNEYLNNKEKQEYFFPAAHVGYDFSFSRLSIKLQIGMHLTEIGREMKGNVFVRPAVRYDITKRFFAQIGLKSMNGAKADWIEFGLGFKVFYRSKMV